MGRSPVLKFLRPFALLLLAAAVSVAAPASVRGQFMFVAVEQQGVDVVIVLFGPDGAGGVRQPERTPRPRARFDRRPSLRGSPARGPSLRQ